MITDLGHAAFAVRDVARTLDFYDRLGIHEAFRLNHPDGSLMLVYLHIAGDRFVEIFPCGPEWSPTHSSFMHLCLLTNDLEGMIEQLRRAGVTIDKEPLIGLDHNRQAWIHDPDGNAIELMQLVEESPQRQTVYARAGQAASIPGI
jgi:lactoylglutathione lyase